MNTRLAWVIAAFFSLAAGAGFAAIVPATIAASNAHARYPADTRSADARPAQPLLHKLVKASALAGPIAKPGPHPLTTRRLKGTDQE